MAESQYIVVHNAHQNNLKDISLKIHKHAITVFTGLSGAGKSSLVFDTIAANSRRELNERSLVLHNSTYLNMVNPMLTALITSPLPS